MRELMFMKRRKHFFFENYDHRSSRICFSFVHCMTRSLSVCFISIILSSFAIVLRSPQMYMIPCCSSNKLMTTSNSCSIRCWIYLGKSHNSSWQRLLCQTRPPLPPQDFVKKIFAKAREFRFFHIFSTVLIVYHTGFSPLSLKFCICCPCPRLKFHHCEKKTRKYLASFFKKWIFPSFGKDFPSTPPPPSDFTLWQRYLCQLELCDFP